MSLYSEWKKQGYEEKDRNRLQAFWSNWFPIEKGIYAEILQTPETHIEGSVKELAERFGITLVQMAGFIDGINSSLSAQVDVDALEDETPVTLDIDLEKLYKNMVESDADWLYNLPEWEPIFDEEKRKELYKEQKISHTFKRQVKKVGRNDPCPCGSGKKYKNCCMKKDMEAEKAALQKMSEV